MRTSLIALVAFVAMAIGGCGSTSETEELSRIASPGGKYDAVLFSLNGGATTSFVYMVYLTEHGPSPKDDDLVFRVDKSGIPEMARKDNELLEIQCAEARIWQFRNFKYFGAGEQWTVVHVALKCGPAQAGVG